MKHPRLDPSIFSTNRKRFAERLPPESLAIFVSNDLYPSNADAYYPFKQNSTLYWLTGIVQEDTYLIFQTNSLGTECTETLVLAKPDPFKEKWDGKLLDKEEAMEIAEIKNVVWKENFHSKLQVWMHQTSLVFLHTNENDRKNTTHFSKEYAFVQELMNQYPLHQYHRSAPIIRQLRAVKTAKEIEVVKEAIKITAKAFERVCSFVKPGVMEYEIEAEIIHEFLRNRASGEAYSSIIASGDRARTLHYVYNNQECKNGELLLMDFGACYGGYNADLTRTIPVNGTFTTRQRELYEACLQLHIYAKSLLKPGVLLDNYTELVGEKATELMLQIGLLTEQEIEKQTKDHLAYKKYLYHGISHHLGVDVHDIADRHFPLKEGMLLTVEPGIYIEKEQVGIRIENNILLTKDGNVDLMAEIPYSADDIEYLMKKIIKH